MRVWNPWNGRLRPLFGPLLPLGVCGCIKQDSLEGYVRLPIITGEYYVPVPNLIAESLAWQ